MAVRGMRLLRDSRVRRVHAVTLKQRKETPVKTIRIFLSLLLALTVLQGCGKSGGGGGSSSSSPANGAVRLVNGTPALASLDLTTSGATLAPAVATGSASVYAGIAPGSYVFSLNTTGTGIPLTQQPLLISSGVSYA